MSIFDLVQSQELAAYWIELSQDEAPYMGEELFPDDKKLGLDLKWIKGAKGLPVVLKTSAFDVKAIPRNRIAFNKLSTQMPYFKESSYIDEELRQQLNMVLETGNQAYIDSVINNVFDDEMRLIRGARASRERMRMQAITTGIIAMKANGQTYTYDYGVTHKANSSAYWGDATTDIIEDIRVAKEQLVEERGVEVTRAICNSSVLKYFRNNEVIRKAIYVLTNGAGSVSETQVLNYVKDELGITIAVNDKRYIDESGNTQKFVPDDVFVLIPDGNLGKTWFGTTPQESDLMTQKVANVSIVDTGVAITTSQSVDPVNVETIVSMICLPSFEEAENIYIIDTSRANAGQDPVLK